MSRQDPLKYLQSLTGFGIRLDLAPTLRSLAHLHHPERKYKTVLVAGTNGKGSVAAMTASVLSAAGIRTGLYTSPHLLEYRERIRVDGKMISRRELRDLIEETRRRIKEDLTYFEFTTILAFLYFARCCVEMAVLEVGMGGRLDATNVVTPAVSVISNISLEHRAFLGDNVETIAQEKAGIIKEGGICLTAAGQKTVVQTLEDICKARNARLYRVGRDIRIRRHGRGVFSYRGIDRNLDQVEISLRGEHQVENAALAIGAVEVLSGAGLKISEESVRKGLKAIRWEGRLEILRESPMLVVDGAHNPAGAAVLQRALTRDFSYRRLVIIFGVLNDKDYKSMLRKIAPLADRLILTRPGRTERALSLDLLLETALTYTTHAVAIDDPAQALREALHFAAEEDLICATGSLYLVGEIKKIVSSVKKKPGIEIRS
jgi:dihydrofolate synthase/folylpolyglutamate synthase